MLVLDPEYPATPAELRFDGTASDDLRARFIAALRISPRLSYSLYHQVMPGESIDGAATVSWQQLSFLEPGVSHEDTVYRPLLPGEEVSIAHVWPAPAMTYGHGYRAVYRQRHRIWRPLRYGPTALWQPQPLLRLPGTPAHGLLPSRLAHAYAQPELKRGLPLWRIVLYELAELALPPAMTIGDGALWDGRCIT